jgi:outer membrane murein-binding lipoprotein Lpp
MKTNFRTKARAAAAVLLTAAAMLAGCGKYDDSGVRRDIDDLKDRVTTLESAVAALDAQIEAGAMIKSVTPIAEAPGGWRIEFTGGSTPGIDSMNGAAASAPDPTTTQIEVRTGADGSASIWYTVGDGWTDTGVNIRGPQGEPGPTGPQGPAGPAGVNPEVRVVDNGNDTVTIQYNVTANHPDDSWVNAGEGSTITLDSNPRDRAAILSIVDNAPLGTVTITMNDGDPDAEPAVPNTEYTFAKASGAARFELVGFNERIEILTGETARIRFVVNPSDAFVPTGTGAALDGKWQLNQTGTRASYVTEPTDFALVSVAKDVGGDGELTGQYVATIECLARNPDITDYAMALVLNTGTEAKPSLVSSPTFVLGTREPVQITPGAIAGITFPATGAAPDMDIPATDQYTATIQWWDNNGDPQTNPFAAETEYRATITLTAKAGYTFEGLAEEDRGGFTVNGAEHIGDGVAPNNTWISVLVRFPATEAVVAVGDVYPKEGPAIGVVYEVTDGGRHGKIVSLDEANVRWSTEYVKTGATNTEDGLANMATMAQYIADWSSYPAFAWVHNKNGGTASYASGAKGVWYLPALDELGVLYNLKSTINTALTNTGGTALSTGAYWSSSEHIFDQALVVDSYGPVRAFKGNDFSVRAVRRF